VTVGRGGGRGEWRFWGKKWDWGCFGVYFCVISGVKFGVKGVMRAINKGCGRGGSGGDWQVSAFGGGWSEWQGRRG
jgi:hypothetical protein